MAYEQALPTFRVYFLRGWVFGLPVIPHKAMGTPSNCSNIQVQGCGVLGTLVPSAIKSVTASNFYSATEVPYSLPLRMAGPQQAPHMDTLGKSSSRSLSCILPCPESLGSRTLSHIA